MIRSPAARPIAAVLCLAAVVNSTARAQSPGGSETSPPPALLPAIPVPPAASGFASDYAPPAPAPLPPQSTTIIINQPGPTIVLPPPTLQQSTPVAPVAPAQPVAPPAPVPTGLPPDKPETLPEGIFGWSGLTYVSNAGTHGLTMLDLSNEGQLPHLMAMPSEATDAWSGLYLRPDFNIHWWSGPKGGPDLPAHVFDLYADVGWKGRILPYLGADVAVEPGLYTDFRTTPADGFRWRGHAVALTGLSENFRIVAGVAYFNYNRTKLLPVGGLLITPNAGTELQLTFPEPKISFRLRQRGTHETWGYIAGTSGAGTWAYKTEAGTADWVEYRDYRVGVGLEWREKGVARSHLEVGYVFHRDLNFVSAIPDFKLDDAVMVRVGWTF